MSFFQHLAHSCMKCTWTWKRHRPDETTEILVWPVSFTDPPLFSLDAAHTPCTVWSISCAPIHLISSAYAPINTAESALCCRGDVSIHPCLPRFFLSLINLPLLHHICCSVTDPPSLGSFSNPMLRFCDERQKSCCLLTIKCLELKSTRSNRKLFLKPVHYKQSYNACYSIS